MATAISRTEQAPSRWGSFLVGCLLIAIGVILLDGGVWLIVLGGSWYYVLAGAGLVTSGTYLLKARPQGVLLCLAIYAATWVWAIWEVGFDPWPLVPRVVAQSVLLLLALLCLPGLLRRLALAGLVALLAAPLPGAGQAQTAPAAPRPVGADWPGYGGGQGAMRYSPLATITPRNVPDLEEVWDYGLGSQATLVDFPTEGGSVPALVLPSKQGDIYILDRATGEPLIPVEDRPVPTGGVEPENLSPKQPFSGYHTLAKRDLIEHDMWGMSSLEQFWHRIQFRRAQYDGIFTPPTADRPWIQYPGYNGGSDWGGVAIDPERGVILANYNDMPNHNSLIPREEIDAAGVLPMDEGESAPSAPDDWDPQVGAPWGIAVNAGWRVPVTELLCKQPPYGGIRTIDLATGETLWDQPLGTARRNGPFGLPSYLPFPIGTPNNAGAVVTASGLAFIAAATDDPPRAIDVETGEVVWRTSLPAGGQGTPITYEAGGRQYVATMASGHAFMRTPIGDHVIAYALPAR
jgi:glucose dehydrogenase